MPTKEISWAKSAEIQYLAALEYIAAESIQNAETVDSLMNYKLSKIAKHPEAFPADKYKTKNDGSYRVFLLFKYRVTYKIREHDIQIIRFRHGSMSPTDF